MPRKQLNISMAPEQYAAVQEAAAQEGVKVAVYCRNAILAQAMPEPELPDVAGAPRRGRVAGLVVASPALRDPGQDEGCIAPV